MEILGLGFILFVFIMIIYSNRKRYTNAISKSEDLDKKIDSLKKEIICVNGSTIPNKNIDDVFGNVSGVSEQASTKEEFNVSEKEAMYNMLKKAKEIGANAIIDLQLNTGTYQQQGSQWQVAQCVYSGTAVKVS